MLPKRLTGSSTLYYYLSLCDVVSLGILLDCYATSQRFWFVESVDSPLPSPSLPSLPCPPLPSPALPSPALPSPALPSPPLPPFPPSLPPSRVPNLIKLGPAVWPKRASVAPPWRSASGHFDQAGSSRLAEARECGAALAISE